MPTNWTYAENNISGMNLTLLANLDPQLRVPGEGEAGSLLAGNSTPKQRDAEVGWKQQHLGKSAPWLTTFVATVGVLAGCGRGTAQAASDAEKRAERQAPSAERLWQSANFDFKSSEAQPRECLNRQVFNTNLSAEWGVTHYGGFNGAFGAFGVEEHGVRNPLVESHSSNGRVANDAQFTVFIDGTQIVVLGPHFHPSVVANDPKNPPTNC